ncbi:RluA family pseudouridine synthase [Candidatus Vidania fulgoroideorum]
MKISILYEDNFLLIVKKPYNVCVHKNKCFDKNLVDFFKPKKVYIINRLDKDVSGIVIFSKKKKSNILFLKKEYVALILGKTYINSIYLPIRKNKSSINFITRVDKCGKYCLTTNKIFKTYKYISTVKICIYTGRTHQIRQHFSYIGCPILGDRKYGNFFLNKKIYKKKNRIFLFFRKTIFYDFSRKIVFNIILNIPEEFKNYGST